MFDYFKHVRAELRHVSWPSRRLTITYTVVVVLISLITAAYLGILDFAFAEAIKKLI